MIYRPPSKEPLLEFQKKRGRGGVESLFKEIMAENFPSLGRYLDVQFHVSNKSSHYFSPKIIFFKTLYQRLSKIKAKKKKAAATRGNKFVTYKGGPIRPFVNF